MPTRIAATTATQIELLRRRRSRRCVTFVACVAIGALVSLLVALTAAGRCDVRTWVREIELPASSFRLPRYLHGAWPDPVRITQHEGPGRFATTTLEVLCAEPDAWAPVNRGELPWHKGPRIHVLQRVSFGWPFRCMYHDAHLLTAQRPPEQFRAILDDAAGRAGWRVGVPFPRWAPVKDTRDRLMPRAVLGCGLAGNTAFYAAVLLTAVYGPGAVRQRRRRARGLCERCGYPAGASEACTECGATLPATGQ